MVSVTVRATSAADERTRSNRSGGANRPRPGTRSGSPAPPGRCGRLTLAPGPRPDRDRRAGWHELDRSRRSPRRARPIAHPPADSRTRHRRARPRRGPPDRPARGGGPPGRRGQGAARRRRTPAGWRPPASPTARGRSRRRPPRAGAATPRPGRGSSRSRSRRRTTARRSDAEGRLAEDEPDPGRFGSRASASASDSSARSDDGVPSRTTTSAIPSVRLWRSSPNRAVISPSGAPSRRWTKPRTRRKPSSNASHGLRSRHWPPAGRRIRPPLIRRFAMRPG